MYSVYIHTTPNKKRYVGMTSMPVERRWDKGNGYRYQTLFYRAIVKYGWDNIIHEVVAEGLTKDEAVALEMHLIDLYDTLNPEFGYNQTAGGEGHAGTPLSSETRLKLSEATKRQWSSPLIREKMVSRRYKAIVQYSLDGEFIAEYRSVKDAMKMTGLGANMSYCANGRYKTAYGFVWRWKGDEFTPPTPRRAISDETRRKLSEASKATWSERRRF